MSDHVRLDDLAAPVFDPATRELMDAAAPLADVLELSCDSILDQARAEVGLVDLGDDSFRRPMEVLIGCLVDEAGLSRFGRVAVHTQLVQMARNRLLVEDLISRHPEILDIPIERPIVIAGLPRTGTTHLHNLLAADPALRSLPYWESLEPVPRPGEPTGDGDPRRERTATAVDFTNTALPHLRRMHEMTVDHVHEEIQLLAMEYSTMYFDALAPMPSWRQHYLASDQTPHYRYLRRVLQALTHLRGGRRWVLKSPQHLEQLGPLLEVFPDAVVVLTHRDPVEVTVSMATMAAYTGRLQLERVDPHAIGAYWSARVEELLTSCLRDRDALPRGQVVDVRLDQLVGDEAGTVERIYGVARQPLDAAARAGMGTYAATHVAGRHGTVDYCAEQVGVDPVERARAFAAYRDRFLTPRG